MGRRLIDAVALIKRFKALMGKEIKLLMLIADVIKLIKEQPTVDAVEVVRCEKCKNAIPRQEDDFDGMPPYYCPFVSDYVRGDDFCSHGERKNDGEES